MPSWSGTCRLPVSRVRRSSRSVRSNTDEHLIQRGMIQYIEHPARGRVPVPGCPLRLSDSPVGPLQAAPPLGQSTEDIFAELAGPADVAGEAGTDPDREEAQHVLHA